MKASSLALRTKMLTASQPEEGSIRPLAQRFTVRPRFVGALVVCFHRTGNCLPTPHGGGHPPCMAQSPYASLSGLVQVHPEATLTELCRLLADSEHGVASQSRRQRPSPPGRAHEKKDALGDRTPYRGGPRATPCLSSPRKHSGGQRPRLCG